MRILPARIATIQDRNWSIAQMRRTIQRAVSIGAGALALAALALLVPSPTLAEKEKEKAAKYPVVERMTHKSYVEKIGDTKVEFTMVPIPGGTYVMGSPKTE